MHLLTKTAATVVTCPVFEPVHSPSGLSNHQSSENHSDKNQHPQQLTEH